MASFQEVPNPDEIAKLKVEGTDFQDFESVYVQTHAAEAFDIFRFTAVERQPNPQQFNIMEKCEVELGGESAVTGIITVRQVAYDAENHAVQLQGKSMTWLAAKSSHLGERTWVNKNFKDIVTDVLGPFGLSGEFKDIDTSPYQGDGGMTIEPGENNWSFMERIARMKGIICGTNGKGDFKFVGKNSSEKQGTLEEGKNILRMQCIFSAEQLSSDYLMTSSSPATDGHSGCKASKLTGKVKGSMKYLSPIMHPMEWPGYTNEDCVKRAKMERIWNQGTIIQAIVTMQGWKSDGGELWKPFKTVHIKSDMCPMDAEMTIQSATFTQDNHSGTLSILECVPPFALKGSSDYNTTSKAAPPDPAQLDK